MKTSKACEREKWIGGDVVEAMKWSTTALRLDVERVVRVLGRVSGGGKKRRVSCNGALRAVRGG
jgi:hypothetical protein